MTNSSLAQSYLIKATKRFLILQVLLKEKAYSDVVREAQEITELALKAMLRQAGIEPPKWHDVGSLLVEHKQKLPKDVRQKVFRLARISKDLRKERELAFYGDIDFIPTEEYSRADARKAISDVKFVLAAATHVVRAQ